MREIGHYVGCLLFEDFLEFVLVDQVELSSHVGLEVELSDAVVDLVGSGELDEADFLGDFGHFVAEDRDSFDVSVSLEFGEKGQVFDEGAQVFDDDDVSVFVSWVFVGVAGGVVVGIDVVMGVHL